MIDAPGPRGRRPASRRWLRWRPFPPHPNPLPVGEGARPLRGPQTAAPSPQPSPRGRGRILPRKVISDPFPLGPEEAARTRGVSFPLPSGGGEGEGTFRRIYGQSRPRRAPSARCALTPTLSRWERERARCGGLRRPRPRPNRLPEGEGVSPGSAGVPSAGDGEFSRKERERECPGALGDVGSPLGCGMQHWDGAGGIAEKREKCL